MKERMAMLPEIYTIDLTATTPTSLGGEWEKLEYLHNGSDPTGSLTLSFGPAGTLDIIPGTVLVFPGSVGYAPGNATVVGLTGALNAKVRVTRAHSIKPIAAGAGTVTQQSQRLLTPSTGADLPTAAPTVATDGWAISNLDDRKLGVAIFKTGPAAPDAQTVTAYWYDSAGTGWLRIGNSDLTVDANRQWFELDVNMPGTGSSRICFVGAASHLILIRAMRERIGGS